MGVVVSSNAATKEQKRQHDDIEKLLAAETAQNVNLFKMLLLGEFGRVTKSMPLERGCSPLQEPAIQENRRSSSK